MFGAVSFGKPGFANSLVLRIGLLILFALTAFALSFYLLVGRPSIDRLAESQMRLMSEQLEGRLGRLFKTVEVTLRSSQSWGMNGDYDHAQLQRFNEFFFPIIAHQGEIASVIFAHESGREILLLRSEDGRWINRLSDPQRWGRQTYWITWTPERTIERVEVRELDYDARTRPWFEGAMALDDIRQIHWTDPYIFYTTQEAGVTAAMQWRAADGSRYVIGHDVRLRDIAQYTTRLGLGHGKAALLTGEGRLIAPPQDPRFHDPAAIREAMLKTPAELDLHELADGYAAWQSSGRPADRLGTFHLSGDGRWLTLFRPFDTGSRTIWLGIFAPEADFIPASATDFALLALITLSSLALGMIVAVRIARRFGEPLDALAADSQRIGRLALENPVATDAPWREVTQLAASLEGMRRHLQNAQAASEAANAELEGKVAERTRALQDSQAILQQREAFFRAIFDNAAVGILSLDAQQRPTQVNRAYADFTGYPVERLLGGDGPDLLPPDERQRLQAALADIADGRRPGLRSEFEFVAPGGEARFGDVQITPIRNGGETVESLLVTVLDVTDRRQIERELIRQFSFLQALLDTIPNPIFYKGAHTRFLGCNRAYEAFFGVDRGEFIGKRVLDLDYLPEEARRAYQAEDEQVIADCGRISREVAMQAADGELHDTLYSVTGFHTTDGEPGGLIGVIVDITPMKNAEREAERARRAAEDAAAAKADFLANMSHEIRTPMNAIIGMTHLALQTELTPRQQNYLSKVDAAAKGLLGIINDILDLSKIEAGKMSVERTAFELDACLQHLADVCQLKARERELELLFDIAPDVPGHLLGDPLRLGQVLLNLLGNALKFTEKGEIRLVIRVAGGDPDDVELRFEVIDTGIGMDEAQQRQVFQAFSQADTSTTRKYGGTGLGLSISKRIVELMGGEIGVSSTLGVGSNFHFTARFGRGAGVADTPRRLGLPDHLPTLVVDDSPAARTIFRDLLQALGLACRAVDGGPAALAEMRRAANAGEPYQLLLIDWQMPGMDGIETLRRLAEAGLVPDSCRVIMTTAFDQEALGRSLADLAVGAILTKPVTPSSLFDGIVDSLRRGPPAARPTAPSLPGRPLFAGRRLLLVEDNEVNRELAEEILVQSGFAVDCAGNGAEAVARVAQAAYDLVLMDCQMPVMDGYEASRQLRAAGHTGLPIVAMTANTLAGDRERCLAAGMNDHVAKPIDIAQLQATLARWLGVAAERPVPPAAGGASPGRAIDEAAVLARLGGNRPMFERLLRRFRDNQADVVARLQAALAAGDAEQLTLLSHTLRGLAGNLGAEALAAAAGQLESLVRQPGPADPAAVAALIARLPDELAPVFAACAEHGEEKSATADSPPPTEKIDEALAHLQTLLDNDDATANHHFLALRGALTQLADPAQVEQLEREIGRYAFEDAQRTLHRLIQQRAAGRPAV